MSKLTYEAFSREMLVRLQDQLGPEKPLVIQKFRKNNNTMLDGIILNQEKFSVSPTFYMNEFYEYYMGGTSLEEIVGAAWPVYDRDYEEDFLDMEVFDAFENVRDLIAFKFINREANKELLREIPYFEYLDLAIVFYCVCSNNDGDVGSVMIKNDMLKQWGIDKHRLRRAAFKNTKRIFGVEIRDIKEVIIDMILEVDMYDDVDELKRKMISDVAGEHCRIPMYVLTNRSRINGAIGLLYKELHVFADQLEDDFYIIPSSVHEVLLVPASERIQKQDLRKILTDVNNHELDEPDILSDQIYYYSRETRKITL